MTTERSFLVVSSPHNRRLDDGHQRHIRIGRHRDGAEQMGRQLRGQIDGGGAVGAADDGDGGRFLVRKGQFGEIQQAERPRANKGGEDAELRRRAQKEAAWGLAIRGPKSVMAPIPRKIRGG